MFWGNAVGKDKVFVAQKRCVRAIVNIHETDSCKPYFKELKILTMPCLYIFESAMFVKCNIDKFSQVSSLRRAGTLRLVNSNTTLFHESIFAMAPKIYNKLPKCIRLESNVNIFKKKVFQFLVDKCYYSIATFLDDKSIKC